MGDTKSLIDSTWKNSRPIRCSQYSTHDLVGPPVSCLGLHCRTSGFLCKDTVRDTLELSHLALKYCRSLRDSGLVCRQIVQDHDLIVLVQLFSASSPGLQALLPRIVKSYRFSLVAYDLHKALTIQIVWSSMVYEDSIVSIVHRSNRRLRNLHEKVREEAMWPWTRRRLYIYCGILMAD